MTRVTASVTASGVMAGAGAGMASTQPERLFLVTFEQPSASSYRIGTVVLAGVAVRELPANCLGSCARDTPETA